MDKALTVLGIAGSLRRGSYNRALLRTAGALAPPGLGIELYDDLGGLPLYNDDLHQAGGSPAAADLKRRIARADALLIATPEYNHGVPGVLANAIDWASRPRDGSPLRRKPVGIMGAATSPFGTVRGQLALRQVLQSTWAYVMPEPEVLVGEAPRRFDREGALADEATRAVVREFLDAFAAWVARFADPIDSGDGASPAQRGGHG